MLCPVGNVAGSVIPDMLNCEFENEAFCSVTVTLPVFVTVTVCVAVCPATTFPKLTVEGDISKLAVLVEDCEVPDTNAAHPFRNNRAIGILIMFQ